MNLYNGEQLISSKVTKAEHFFDRAKGLLGKNQLSKSETLWIYPCPSVHTFFMKFPIDVVFVDRSLVVTQTLDHLKPWRLSPPFQFKNHSCFEFSSQNISSRVAVGDQLYVRP